MTRTDEPYLTVDDACRYLGFLHDGEPNRKAFYAWKARAKPVSYRMGAGARLLRFRRSDLDAVITTENEVAPELAPHFGTTLRRLLR